MDGALVEHGPLRRRWDFIGENGGRVNIMIAQPLSHRGMAAKLTSFNW